MLAAVIGVALSSVALSACGSDPANASARQACQDVAKSISTYEESLHQATPAAAARLSLRAAAELRIALPLASAAADSDQAWEGLESTLSETDRLTQTAGSLGSDLNEGDLITGLRSACDPYSTRS